MRDEKRAMNNVRIVNQLLSQVVVVVVGGGVDEDNGGDDGAVGKMTDRTRVKFCKQKKKKQNWLVYDEFTNPGYTNIIVLTRLW